MHLSSPSAPPRGPAGTVRALVLIAPLLVPGTLPGAPQGPVAGPALGAAPLEEVLAPVRAAVEGGELAGAVLVVGRGQEVLLEQALGHRALAPAREPMTAGTRFDLASLTKTMATAPAVLLLAERGRLELEAPVARYLPAFAANGKGEVTVLELLLHTGGLPPANPLADFAAGPGPAMERLLACAPRGERGRFVYSDVGYLVLGHLVEVLSGRGLDEFVAAELHGPLGLARTGFRPADPADCAPTERLDPSDPGSPFLRGTVHDPRARALGGVAGHAGLFGTAADVGRFCRWLLSSGEGVLPPAAMEGLRRPVWLEEGTVARTPGLDVVSPYDSPRGGFPRGVSLGHTGFTGTSLWVDPASGAWIVLLTSRLHPDGQGSVVALRRAVGEAAARVLAPGPGAGAPSVRSGIDVLVAEDFARLAGRRVALLTNRSAVDAGLRRTLDLLHVAPRVELVRVLTPEHGFGADAEGDVEDGRDAASGLPLVSLYGATRRPTAEMLADVDDLVFDVQDVGTRIYTYATTLGYAMEEAGRHGVRVVVLDRPNPLGGERVSGPAADPGRLSFISYRPIPFVHGMTLGELARLYRGAYGVECELHVVELEGWRRSMGFEDTGLPWIDPSPNMRSATQALLYPGVGLLEACNLSVGRGTDQPFERLGAPWVDGVRLARALTELDLPGLAFTPIVFTPRESRFEGERCEGVQVLVTERDRVRPVELGFALAWTLERLFARDFEMEKVLDRLLALEPFLALRSMAAPGPFEPLWIEDVRAFRELRGPWLLYD